MNARLVFHVAPNGAWLGLLVQPYRRVAPKRRFGTSAPAFQQSWICSKYREVFLPAEAQPTYSVRSAIG